MRGEGLEDGVALCAYYGEPRGGKDGMREYEGGSETERTRDRESNARATGD